VLVTTLAACSGPEAGVGPTANPGSGPAAASELPVPGSTLAASSIDAPDGIPADQRISVLAVESTSEGTADMTAALEEVRDFAREHDAILTVADIGEGPVDADALLQSALPDEADVVVILGGSLASALDRVSAANLGQQFLILGAQLPEPTENVTAVVWPGADTRGGDGAEPALAARTPEALEVGLSAVAGRTTGIVVALP
jgi:hypothetical protein